jgi:hypothetical protein
MDPQWVLPRHHCPISMAFQTDVTSFHLILEKEKGSRREKTCQHKMQKFIIEIDQKE